MSMWCCRTVQRIIGKAVIVFCRDVCRNEVVELLGYRLIYVVSYADMHASLHCTICIIHALRSAVAEANTATRNGKRQRPYANARPMRHLEISALAMLECETCCRPVTRSGLAQPEQGHAPWPLPLPDMKLRGHISDAACLVLPFGFLALSTDCPTI